MMSQEIALALLCGRMDAVIMHDCLKENFLGRKSLLVRQYLRQILES